jgi:hypothetical protein
VSVYGALAEQLSNEHFAMEQQEPEFVGCQTRKFMTAGAALQVTG